MNALKPFPATIESVSPGWLSAALSQRFPGTAVDSIDWDNVQQTTATKLRLNVRYARGGNPAGLPTRMYLKGGLSIAHVYDSMVGGYAAEAMFYRDFALAMDIPVPGCYFADIDAEGQALVLLEDLGLRQVTYGSNLAPIEPETIKQGLALLARLHASSWGAPFLQRLIQYPGVIADIGLQLLTDDYLAACLAKPRARAVPAALRTLDSIVIAQKALWERPQNEGICMLHGDPHLGNWYFEASGEPRLLDWQGVQSGNWAHDVTYFIIGSQSIEHRRAHEHAQIQHYLQALASHGVAAPSFDRAWQLYRENALHGFMWLLNPVELQSEQITEACSVRFSTAVGDLESLQALGL